ncbi:prolactin receptor a [Parambassis ranga]|uniref:Prolactin receptor n=1 Tax=Parambassis ranga TaxID=210632 RepID=A0A6P7J956_9TELE|nr:prolactin receptor [Parambassis ranga]
MMRKAGEIILLLLLPFVMTHADGTHYRMPGKPTLTSCRSPEKETFTCWWEPGPDWGLRTTYALYYRKENSEMVYECPDYRTAGANSCYFNKNDTSIWVNYNITVVATNSAGSTFSDSVDIDVVYIVQPNPPERVTATILEDKGWPFLRVSWEPPHKADTRSGWITLFYQIRVKLEGESEWEMHYAGQQKTFNIYSLRSGGTYLVQVNCKPDHGFWSDWSSTSYVKVPEYYTRERSVWLLIALFSAFIFLILIWLIHMNIRSLKHCILPPVPGPKIKGFDRHLLKNGKCDEVFSTLVVSDFPPTMSSNYEDLLVEYLEVYIPEEHELMLEESKDLHDGFLKSEGSASDSDSGRGSCDSHTLLMDKCGEVKEKQTDQEGGRMGTEAHTQQADWDESHEDMVSPDMSSGRVKTWPSVFSPLPQYSPSPLHHPNTLETAWQQQQHYLSDTLLPADSLSSDLSQAGHNIKDTPSSNYWKFCLSNKRPHLLQTDARWHLQAHSDVNISNISHKEAPACTYLSSLRSTEYVEVQRVNEEDRVLLHPVSSERHDGKDCLQLCHGEDYSKVKGVDIDNVLLLHREVMEEEVDMCLCDNQETNGATESCYTTITPQKPTSCIQAQAMSGYVDTATMFAQPSH